MGTMPTHCTDKAFLDQLPTELCLVIYEDLLQTKKPLTKRANKLTPAHSGIGIIFASKKIYEEALPVLYKNNTISVTHDNICGNPNTIAARFDYSLLQRLDIRLDPNPYDRWMRCHCGSIWRLAENLVDETAFPELRRTVVYFDHDLRATTIDKEKLREKRLGIARDTVGRFHITGIPGNREIVFEHEDLVRGWEQLTRTTAGAIWRQAWPHYWNEPPLAQLEFSPRVRRRIQRLCAAYHCIRGSLPEDASVDKPELLRRLLKPPTKRDPIWDNMDINELITVYLHQRA